MFMPTVGFMRSMSFDKRCPGCGCRYWGAMETENVGTCGQCLSAAFPSPMRTEPKIQKPLVRKFSHALAFSQAQKAAS
jgi:hypothetical protein